MALLELLYYVNLKGKKVVVVEGTRIPFLRSGTNYQDLMAYQLGAMAIRGLLSKATIEPDLVERVIHGYNCSQYQKQQMLLM